MFIGGMGKSRLSGAEFDRREGAEGLVGKAGGADAVESEGFPGLYQGMVRRDRRAVEACGAGMDLGADESLYLFEGFEIVSLRPYVHHEAAAVRDDVGLGPGLDLGVLESFFTEDADVFHGLVDGIYPISPRGVP